MRIMATKATSRPAGFRKGTTTTARKKAASKNPAAHIMPAPKGARTVSHQRIKAAVEAVFRARTEG